MTWDKSCKFAPSKEFAKHCKKENEGNEKSPHRANKGKFGCAKHCRYYEAEK